MVSATYQPLSIILKFKNRDIYTTQTPNLDLLTILKKQLYY